MITCAVICHHFSDETVTVESVLLINTIHSVHRNGFNRIFVFYSCSSPVPIEAHITMKSATKDYDVIFKEIPPGTPKIALAQCLVRFDWFFMLYTQNYVTPIVSPDLLIRFKKHLELNNDAGVITCTTNTFYDSYFYDSPVLFEDLYQHENIGNSDRLYRWHSGFYRSDFLHSLVIPDLKTQHSEVYWLEFCRKEFLISNIDEVLISFRTFRDFTIEQRLIAFTSPKTTDCCICLDAEAKTVLVHPPNPDGSNDGHMITCKECARQFLNQPCPICRQIVVMIVDVY